MAGGLRGRAPALQLRGGDSHIQPHGWQAVPAGGQVDVLHRDPCDSLGRSRGETGMSQPMVWTEMGLRSCWRGFGQCLRPVLRVS